MHTQVRRPSTPALAPPTSLSQPSRPFSAPVTEPAVPAPAASGGAGHDFARIQVAAPRPGPGAVIQRAIIQNEKGWHDDTLPITHRRYSPTQAEAVDHARGVRRDLAFNAVLQQGFLGDRDRANVSQASSMPKKAARRDLALNAGLQQGFLGHRDLANVSQASKTLRNAAPGAPLEGTKTTFGELTSVMGGHRLTGYHGGRRADADSLYEGLDPEKFGTNTSGGQLGAGFYMIDSTTPAGREMARGWIVYNSGNNPGTVYPVFTRGLAPERVFDREDPRNPSTGTWPSSIPEAYQHPSWDAARDRIDDGGNPELKLNPHFFSANERESALDTLKQHPRPANDPREGPREREEWDDYKPDYDTWAAINGHEPKPLDPELAQQERFSEEWELLHRAPEFGAQIGPPEMEQGHLGPQFLAAIKRKAGPRRAPKEAASSSSKSSSSK